MEILVIAVGLFHLFYTPFTKVEESFNMQAMHDILYHRWNFSEYDHLEFPGVVPRTFLGPLLLSFISSPFIAVMSFLNLGTKFLSQYVVRVALCLCVTLALIKLQNSIKRIFGREIGWWFLVVTASQYHLLYYSSRPLPNTFALVVLLLAIDAAWNHKVPEFITLSGMAIVWFRFELILILIGFLFFLFLDRHITIERFIKLIIPIGTVLVATTVIIDSFFWQRLSWPEAEVFYFNLILNKSSEWGTSPFLWYFYSALPRGMASSLLLLPVGIYLEPRVRSFTILSLLYVICFSFLPHKELRFIFYVFPLLNIPVAAACHRLWINRYKSKLRWVFGMAAVGHILFNICFTLMLLAVAGWNYPGGAAIYRLHQLVSPNRTVDVHITNLAAQTGVTRFTQIHSNWSYCKAENISTENPEIQQFTHLLIEAKSKYSANLKPLLKTHSILSVIEGFSQISVNYNNLIPPVKIKTKPCIYILERNLEVKKIVKQMEVDEPIVEDDLATGEDILESKEDIAVDTNEFMEEGTDEANATSIEQLLEEYTDLLNSGEQTEVDNIEDATDQLLEKSLSEQDIVEEIIKLSKLDLSVDNVSPDKLKDALKLILDDYKKQSDNENHKTIPKVETPRSNDEEL